MKQPKEDVCPLCEVELCKTELRKNYDVRAAYQSNTTEIRDREGNVTAKIVHGNYLVWKCLRCGYEWDDQSSSTEKA